MENRAQRAIACGTLCTVICRAVACSAKLLGEVVSEHFSRARGADGITGDFYSREGNASLT